MGLSLLTTKLKSNIMNRNGFTFLMAIFMVMIIGIMLGLTGQSWKTIMKREHEKELLFRGSQIKEAIENWNNPKYTVPGVAPRTGPRPPLMDLKYLLDDPTSTTHIRFLPHTYATELDDKNPKCAPDCPKLKVYQDPMTGKEWTIIRGTAGNAAAGQVPTISTSTQGAGIIGVASKSDEEPLKTDFKDTALENMGTTVVGAIPGAAGTVPLVTFGTDLNGPAATSPALGGKMTKYSDWKFIAETTEKNDHSKIYRAYHERW
jgi:type II secretory pathway pseudopilin PulG